MSTRHPLATSLLVLCLGGLAPACGDPVALGARDGGRPGADGRVPGAPRADECGNGLDDDGDGRIDEGCPCAPGETQACFAGPVARRAVGACADGAQTCGAAAGAEWGDWGEAPCVGGTGPAPEACDGADRDCDGAIDEGCPCDAGETRACAADPARTAPCAPGTQACDAAGTWGECAGATVPAPDVCDGVDNDCDGTTDEGCGCDPAPEVCGSGVDEDCDGEVDEAGCAGRPDGGTCVPASEACNGGDDDCDGTIDEGVCDACRCESWGTAGAYAPIPLPNPFGMSPERHRNFEVAFDGDGVLAFVTGGDGTGVRDGRVSFAQRRSDGSVVGVDRTLAPAATQIVGVAWAGTRWIAAWREPAAGAVTTAVVALDRDGATVAGPARLDGFGATAVAAAADGIYLSGGGGAAGASVRRLDASLAPVGAPIALSRIAQPFDLRAVAGGVAVVGPGEPGTTVYLALIRAGTLVRETELQQIATTYRGAGLGLAFVAEDGDGIVPCWAWAGGLSCRYLSPTDGRAIGPAFLVSLDTTVAWDVVRASCSMALVSALQFGSGSAGRFLVSHFDPTGAVETTTLDRQWVQPRQTLRAFVARDGRLVRVADASRPLREDGQLEVLVSTLRCREPPPPVTDCAELQRTVCGLACSDLCARGASECFIQSGNGSGFGFPAASCGVTHGRVDCDRIDAARCREALARPQECAWGTGPWLIPADCVLPR